jgi:hypothetical protein
MEELLEHETVLEENAFDVDAWCLLFMNYLKTI